MVFTNPGVLTAPITVYSNNGVAFAGPVTNNGDVYLNSNNGGGAAVWMLGQDANRKVVTNAVPTSGGSTTGLTNNQINNFSSGIVFTNPASGTKYSFLTNGDLNFSTSSFDYSDVQTLSWSLGSAEDTFLQPNHSNNGFFLNFEGTRVALIGPTAKFLGVGLGPSLNGGPTTISLGVGSDSSLTVNQNVTCFGVETTSTNRLVFTSVSSFTNTIGRDAFAIFSAGTSIILQDTNGNNIATLGTIATLDLIVPMRVNMRASGTAMSAILY